MFTDKNIKREREKVIEREREKKWVYGFCLCRKGRERRTEKRIDIDDIHTASSSSSR
jgi:hypothetical protein